MRQFPYDSAWLTPPKCKAKDVAQFQCKKDAGHGGNHSNHVKTWK